VKKYAALEQATDDDGLLRYTLQFAGAGRTWRWAGRKYQAQNLARPAWWLEKTQVDCVRDLGVPGFAEQIEWLYPKPMDLLSTCVRPVVQAPPGYVLADADLNAIENRVLGWIADDRKILSVFENKPRPLYRLREIYVFAGPTPSYVGGI
jgi:DNA polymerase